MPDPVPDVTLRFPVAPMKATMGSTAAIPDGDDWAFEVKWDGYRTIVHVADGRVRLQSTAGHDVTDRWPELSGLADSLNASSASSDAIVTARAVAPTATIIPAMIYQVVGESKLRRVADDTAITELRAQVVRERGEELADFLGTYAPDTVTDKPLLEIGDPNERLPELPDERHCDLIVVGTHGRTGIRYTLLGSVAEHVLRDSDRDVLLARQGPSMLQPT